MDALTQIKRLIDCGPRGPGTEAEGRAAIELASRLRELNRSTDLEPIRVRPNAAITHLIHAVAAIIASVVSVSSPVAGLALAVATAVSMLSDLSSSQLSARLLTLPASSQNVVSPEQGQKLGKLVLVAHYDAGKSSVLFGSGVQAIRARLARILRYNPGAFQVFFASVVGIAICTALRLLFGPSITIAAVQFAFTAISILVAVLAADYALSDESPGANDNASGTATALRLAQRYTNRLSNFDLWVLLPGADEGLLGGTHRFLRTHADELDRESTLFLNIDAVGAGEVRYATSEGPLLALKFHPALVDLCRSLGSLEAMPAKRWHGMSSAFTARASGFAAISIGCRDATGAAAHSHQATDTVDNLDPDSLERAFGFLSQLIEAIDVKIGPTLKPQAPTPGSERPSPA